MIWWVRPAGTHKGLVADDVAQRRAQTYGGAAGAGIPAGHTCVHVRAYVRRRHCLRTHADGQVDPFGDRIPRKSRNVLDCAGAAAHGL